MKLIRLILTVSLVTGLLLFAFPGAGLAQGYLDGCADLLGNNYTRIARYDWNGASGQYDLTQGSNAVTFSAGSNAYTGSWVVNPYFQITAVVYVDGDPQQTYLWQGYTFSPALTNANGAQTYDVALMHGGTGPTEWGPGMYYNGTAHAISHIDFCGSPTAVTLDSFAGSAASGKVTLTWKTALEKDNAGFNLYRYTVDGGQLVKVNGSLIAAKAEGSTGASYSFVDKPGAGTFYYYLEDVSTSGIATRHGPVQLTIRQLVRRPLYRPLSPAY